MNEPAQLCFKRVIFNIDVRIATWVNVANGYNLIIILSIVHSIPLNICVYYNVTLSYT